LVDLDISLGWASYLRVSDEDKQTPERCFSGQADISTWVITQCKVVTGFEAVTRNAGAPGGILTGPYQASFYDQDPGGTSFPGGRDMQVSLYDCGG